jgi:hypothetical protein
MKKVIEVRKQYRLNNGEWTDVTDFNPISYREKDECVDKYRTIDTWKDTVGYVADGLLPNAEMHMTFFKKRIYLILPNNNIYSDFRTVVNEKDFKKLEVRVIYREPILTIKQLANILEADEFCEYLKDKGISTCPMLK